MAHQKKLKLATTLITLVLVLIALIALLEKGPPPIYVYSEASPANPGPLGTLYLLNLLSSRYKVSPIFTLDNLYIPKNDVCVYTVISPVIPYRREEAKAIVDVLKNSCNRFSLLIADEYNTSNSILEVAGSSIRVLGEVIGITGALGDRGYTTMLVTLGNISMFYPEAVIYVGNKSYTITLDIASRVVGGNIAGYTVDRGVEIAAYEHIDSGGIAYVIGDGSVFLNQVINSNKTVYREFILDLFDYLCFNNSKCYILIDGSHHTGRDILSLGIADLARSMASPLEALHILTMYIARILHPSFWLPPLVEIINSISYTLLTIAIEYPILLIFLILLIYMLFSRRTPRVQDVRLIEQVEREYFVTADVRKAIIGGKVKLGREDFVRLYNMVDSVLRSIKGVGLGDPKAVDVLKGILGDKEAARFVKDMNRLYLKALRKRLLPIVFSWNRTTMKKLRVCENMLKALGVSLEAEKGVEYVLMRGVISV